MAYLYGYIYITSCLEEELLHVDCLLRRAQKLWWACL